MRGRGLRYRTLKRLRGLRRIGGTPRLIPEGKIGIMMIGHRDYVGGMWEEMGRLQFEFLVSRGLQPDQVFLDIGCGSLRGGVHFIRYLQPGNYLGIEKEGELIGRGLVKELPPGVRAEKRPEFVVSDSFGFAEFSKHPDVSLAQSLFTHLNADHIELCLSNLRANVPSGHEFYATFTKGDSAKNPAARSHSRGLFRYSPDELAQIGQDTGWSGSYIGDWGHPRQQVMMHFTTDQRSEVRKTKEISGPAMRSSALAQEPSLAR
jgi:SAM-dependent methyltransferase